MDSRFRGNEGARGASYTHSFAEGSFRQVSLAGTSVLDVLHFEGDELLVNLSIKSTSC
ncbi:hypothetical protein SAMN06298226_2436 [Nitrosovibrio sp. Nv4]|nr:hypothetical protein SAMN06298226_2436 [Nitrosovibrio sp. Nv4]